MLKVQHRSKPLRRDECYTVGITEITERIVGGDDLAAVGGDFGDCPLDLFPQFIELTEKGCGISVVTCFSRRVERDEAVKPVLGQISDDLCSASLNADLLHEDLTSEQPLMIDRRALPMTPVFSPGAHPGIFLLKQKGTSDREFSFA